MKYSAVIVASGKGSRMNLGYNKVYYEYKPGKMVIDLVIETFKNDLDCDEIIVVTNKDEFYKLNKYPDIKVVEGGKERYLSVYNGLKEVNNEYVMIHDGARFNIQNKELEKLKDALKTNDACLLMVPSVNSLKEVRDGYVVKSLDRSVIYDAQTPQAFKTDIILKAYSLIKSDKVYTDDVSIVEDTMDVKVKVVIGDYGNIKLTNPDDLKFLEDKKRSDN